MSIPALTRSTSKWSRTAYRPGAVPALTYKEAALIRRPLDS